MPKTQKHAPQAQTMGKGQKNQSKIQMFTHSKMFTRLSSTPTPYINTEKFSLFFFFNITLHRGLSVPNANETKEMKKLDISYITTMTWRGALQTVHQRQQGVHQSLYVSVDINLTL